MSRRNAIAAAVEVHNRAHPTARLPRPAARLLAVMFANDDVCHQSLEALVAEGFTRNAVPGVLRALVAGRLPVEAGRLSPDPEHLSPPPPGRGRRMRARLGRREKVFGPGRAVPLDRNAKARIMAYARAWGARHRQPGQHRGPITRAFLEVLEALLWGFHNSPDRLLLPVL